MIARIFALSMLTVTGPDAARLQGASSTAVSPCQDGERRLTQCPGSGQLQLAIVQPQPLKVPADGSGPAGQDCASATPSSRCRPLIGINLATASNYSRELPFLDFMKLAGQPGANGRQPTADELDADGWLRSMPANGAQWQWANPLEDAPNNYVLLYDGSPAVSSFDPRAKEANAFSWNAVQIGKLSPGRITFRSTGNAANFSIAHLDPAAPIRNVRIVRADQEKLLAKGVLLNPDFVAFAKKFSVLRTMDWTCTNGSTLVTWSARPKLTDAYWGCVPLEVQIAAANAAGADL